MEVGLYLVNGVLIDSQLSMSNHIAALSRSCFFHLRQLKLIRQSLMPEAMTLLDWTPATVYLSVSATNFYRGCR